MKHASYKGPGFLILTFEDGSWGIDFGGSRNRPSWFGIGFYRFWPIYVEWRLGRAPGRSLVFPRGTLDPPADPWAGRR